MASESRESKIIDDTKDTEDTVHSLLCGPNIWRWDPEGTCSISFNENGTGLLRAGAGFSIFIAAETEWKLKSSRSLDDVIILDNVKDTLVSQFDLEITLTTRLHPALADRGSQYSHINEGSLLEDAFQAKNYTIRLEYGRFDQPNAVRCFSSSRPFLYRGPKYALRLVFDKSPFPGPGEYKQVGSYSAEEFRFWEYKAFVDKEVPEDSLPLALVNNAISWWTKEPGLH